MHHAFVGVSCVVRGGNPYWGEYAFILFMLTWGIIMNRREGVQPRIILRLVAGIGCLLTFLSGVAAFVADLNHADDALLLFAVKSAAVSTGAVYLELLLSPRRHRIPPAIARDR